MFTFTTGSRKKPKEICSSPYVHGRGAPLNRTSENPVSFSPLNFITMFLIIALSVLAWVATFSGMKQLVDANLSDSGGIYYIEIIALAFATAILQAMILFISQSFFY